uniref:RagB/SusD family nutrient uptake outer membrane protein n=1 Tax=Roseihalotalea indica TaxID=2867963 RepID=A0AA49GL44_9BACT|nr:RagB/SusD family nutrient uptake outer membrane protein [Tunicatimonas sp. TK19036]
MKSIIVKYSLILFSALMLLAGACTDLEEEVYSEVISENFVPTENDLPSLIAPVYTVMRPMMAGWQGYFDVQEESADQIITPVRPNGWYDGGTYQRMHQHAWTSLQWQPTNLWNNCYNGINTANRVLYQLESGEIPLEEGKEELLAELKVARAFFYYILLDNHGNVPIVTDFTATELPLQSTRQQVYDFVVSELTTNIPLLTETADQTTYGRFNKWAGKTILAKVYLNSEVYVDEANWEAVIEQCDDIINSGAYMLEPLYKDNFITNNENSREMIFAVPYDDILATGNLIHMKTLDPISQRVFNMLAQPWGGNCAVPQFINTYDTADIRLTDTWIQGPQIGPAGTELINYVNYVESMDESESNQGYRIGKYEIIEGARGSLSNDFPVFRYADVLMMKAEALLRTGQADAAAELVTQVRSRAFADPAKAKVTGAELMEGSSYQYGYWESGEIDQVNGGADIPYGRFLDELGWEFAAEAHRRQDLIRFGVFSTKTWFQHRPSSADKALFPIPDAEINKNPNLKQNPGY